VLIISISYSLVSFKFGQKKSEITPLEIKQILKDLKTQRLAETLSLKCFGKNCQICKIYEKNKAIKEMQLFTQKPNFFAFDKNGHFEKLKQKKDYCFKLDLYKNNSTNAFFMEYKNNYYIFDSFAKTQKFSHLEEAIHAFDPKEILPRSQEEYYAF